MTNKEELVYAMALEQIPQIGTIQAKVLLDYFGDFSSIFSSTKGILENISGIGSIRAKNILDYKNFDQILKQVEQLQRSTIEAIIFSSPQYPSRLKHCDDAPTILYYKGNQSFNADKVIAIVGTRKPTEQGRQYVRNYLEALIPHQPIVVSGLAYGIDYQAHRVALDLGLPTIGVLANGLHTIYPGIHTDLAREMIHKGGLLTEFPLGTKPDKQNFPKRNRLVAGMCDALLVIETDRKGGSMITAEIAASYNRDIFALPGRITDTQSRGCNELIRENKARLTLSPQDLIEYMNWESHAPKLLAPAPVLFAHRTEEEMKLIKCLQEFGTMHVDRFMVIAGLSPKQFHQAILTLELDGICKRFSGNHFSLIS